MQLTKSGNITILALALIIAVSSCKKTTTPTPAVAVTKFTDIKAPATFNWSTVQKVNFQVAGFSAVSNEKNTLKVTSTDGQKVYFTQFQSMSDNVNTSFSVPRNTTSLLVTFGSIQKTVNIDGGKALFTYTEVLTD